MQNNKVLVIDSNLNRAGQLKDVLSFIDYETSILSSEDYSLEQVKQRSA